MSRNAPGDYADVHRRGHFSKVSHDTRSHLNEADMTPPKHKKSQFQKSCTFASFFSPNCRKSQIKSKTTETVTQDDNEQIVIDMREEIYEFDHGESNQYRTTDHLPNLKSDKIANDVHQKFTVFWAETFGYLNVFVAFFVSFFIQLYRWVDIESAIIINWMNSIQQIMFADLFYWVFLELSSLVYFKRRQITLSNLCSQSYSMDTFSRFSRSFRTFFNQFLKCWSLWLIWCALYSHHSRIV